MFYVVVSDAFRVSCRAYNKRFGHVCGEFRNVFIVDFSCGWVYNKYGYSDKKTRLRELLRVRENKMQDKKSEYDYMRESDEKEEDAFYPEEWNSERTKSAKEEYFEYYDDVKTDIKEDW